MKQDSFNYVPDLNYVRELLLFFQSNVIRSLDADDVIAANYWLRQMEITELRLREFLRFLKTN